MKIRKNKQLPNVVVEFIKTKNKDQITLVKDEENKLIGFHLSYHSGNM